MIQLYGNLRSRATRCLWMLEETGQPYQLIEKSTRADDLQTAEYARLNPNARIPTLVDGDVTLWESMAINIYLAQRYDGPLHLAGPKELGLARPMELLGCFRDGTAASRPPGASCDVAGIRSRPSQVERSELLLRKPLGVLNDRLTGREYLAGDSFTVADLNVASILAWGRMARLNLSACSEVARWLDACMARPAYRRLRDQAKRT
jgi:glutathione S-transferase